MLCVQLGRIARLITMKLGDKLAVENLRALISLGQHEEKSLRKILAGDPDFKVKIRAQFDLDKVLRRRKRQADELAKLEIAS